MEYLVVNFIEEFNNYCRRDRRINRWAVWFDYDGSIKITIKFQEADDSIYRVEHRIDGVYLHRNSMDMDSLAYHTYKHLIEEFELYMRR